MGDAKAHRASGTQLSLARLESAEIERAVEKLPALPPSASRLLAVLGRVDWHVDELTSVVSLDPILTGRMLSLANSAAYAHHGQITSIRQAIGHLGIGTITSIAVAVAVHSTLRDPLRAYNASAGQLWRHSVAASVAVEGIAAAFRWTPPAASATTALLHDIGKVLLARTLTRAGARLVARVADERRCSTARAEADLLGASHAEVGAKIAEAWRLPHTIVAGIRYHHALHLASSEHELAVCRAVAIGDAVARRICPGLGEVEERWRIERDAEVTHVPVEALAKLVDSTAERLAEVLRLYES